MNPGPEDGKQSSSSSSSSFDAGRRSWFVSASRAVRRGCLRLSRPLPGAVSDRRTARARKSKINGRSPAPAGPEELDCDPDGCNFFGGTLLIAPSTGHHSMAAASSNSSKISSKTHFLNYSLQQKKKGGNLIFLGNTEEKPRDRGGDCHFCRRRSR